MTKPDITAVATLAGRELDAAVHYHLFGVKTTYDWPNAPCPFADVPCYSRGRDPSLFDVLAKLEADGWEVQISRAKRFWHVWVFKEDRTEEASVDVTLPNALNLALARAALLTVYPQTTTPE